MTKPAIKWQLIMLSFECSMVKLDQILYNTKSISRTLLWTNILQLVFIKMKKKNFFTPKKSTKRKEKKCFNFFFFLDQLKHIFFPQIITSNSVQLFKTFVNFLVSIHVIGIMTIGKIFNKNKYAMTDSSKRPSSDEIILIRFWAMKKTYV